MAANVERFPAIAEIVRELNGDPRRTETCGECYWCSRKTGSAYSRGEGMPCAECGKDTCPDCMTFARGEGETWPSVCYPCRKAQDAAAGV